MKIENIKFENLKFDIYIFITYTVVCFIMFYRCLDNYFISDDFILLNVASQGDFSSIFFHYPPILPHYLRPILTLTYKFLFMLFGMSSIGYMLLSLLLHITNSFLVYKTANFVFSNYSGKRVISPVVISILCGLLFTVHYIHSEPVLFIASMGELLFTSFYILAFLYYLKLKLTKTKKYYLFTCIFFILSILSKETALSFIVLLILLEKTYFKSDLRLIVQKFGIIIMIGIIYTVIRFLLFPEMITDNDIFFSAGVFFEMIKNIIFTYTALFFSLDFNMIKNVLKSGGTIEVQSFIEIFYKLPSVIIIIITSIILYIIILSRKNGLTKISFAAIFITVLPTIWIAGFERYLYLPSAAFVFLILSYFLCIYGINKFRNSIIIFILFLLLFYNLYSLRIKINNWERASEMSTEIVNQIKIISPSIPDGSKVYFRNLPDQYNGAWVFRNGIEYIPHLILGRNDLNFYKLTDEVNTESEKKIFVYDYLDGNIIKLK